MTHISAFRSLSSKFTIAAEFLCSIGRLDSSTVVLKKKERLKGFFHFLRRARVPLEQGKREPEGPTHAKVAHRSA